MKKTFRMLGMAIVTIMLAISFTACGDDDDEPDNIDNKLVGTWVQEYSGTYYSWTTTVTFKSNGTWESQEIEYYNGSVDDIYNEAGTWTAKDGILTVKCTASDDPESIGEISAMPYSIQGNMLIIDDEVYYRQ